MTGSISVTKYGHCCLLIEVDGVRIMTDPGNLSTAQDTATSIDCVLITHEHADHMHVESLRKVLANNPQAVVITNTAVSKILREENDITCAVVDGRGKGDVNGIPIEAFDSRHAEIYQELGQVQNTGYLIADKLFYPGDSFHDPERDIEFLALPVAGPWCRISDSIKYAFAVNPKKAFPVHDGVLKNSGMAHVAPTKVLPEHGIEFVPLKDGETITL